MTNITENQYWEIIGLIAAKKSLDQKVNSLAEAYGEIVGEDNKDRFWDFGYDVELDQEDLKSKLAYDKVAIKWNKKK